MKYYLLIFLFIFNLANSETQEVFSFTSKTQSEQFYHLTKELRCLVCQNQTLADSQASLANDIRLEIAKQISEGKNDNEIITYLTKRYGDFILYSPPLKNTTYFLWFFPVGALLLGVIIISYIKYRNRED